MSKGRESAGVEMREQPEKEAVVELEFALRSGEFFPVHASEQAACQFRLEAVQQRSDGSVLEFVSVRGADPERVLDLAAESSHVRDVRLLDDSGESALFEFISESAVATALADAECTFTDITATAGEGTVAAEVPSHVDASAVIEAFLDQYPEAELVARRTTDRQAPTFTESQFRGRLTSSLTDKQLQALRAAHAAGYFEWPREVKCEDIAEEFGVSTPTLSQHLRAAQRKLLDDLF